MVAPRVAEAYITLADNAKIKEVLGWEPKIMLNDYIKNITNS
jgi:nucleoside-diphosphate-sugar epimerase